LICGIAIAAGLAFAQSVSSLRGTVTDPSGASIAEAVVVLTNPATDFTRKGLTNASGEYSFVQVPPGTYKVAVDRSGFTTATRENVVLQVNTPASLDVQLALSGTADVVNVTAESTAINTENASQGNAFTERQIHDLPLLTRNVVELLSLQPGVTPTGEVLGARRDQNNVTLDGVDVNDNQNAGISGTVSDGQGSNANRASSAAGFNSVLPVPLDSVQEFRVTVAGQDANEGRSAGGQVVLVTKSGTNSIHGSAYEYNRNTAVAANDWFNNRAGIERQTLNRNQFGASLGGPIVKNRAFFFLNYERRIDASALAQERYVPSESLKAGLLTFKDIDGSIHTLNAADIAAVDPLRMGLNQGYLNVLKQYPVGNDAPYGFDAGLNFTGYRFNAPDTLDSRAYVGKMDFLLDPAGKHTISVRGTLSNSNQGVETALAQFPGQQPASLLLNNSKGISARYTAVLKANLINTFTFGLTRQGVAYSGVSGTAFTLNSIDSLQNYTADARANGRILPVYNFVDDLNWTKGRHSITGGVNFRYMTNNRFTYANSYPSFGYSTSVAKGLGQDIQTAVSNYAGVGLDSPDAVANAMGVLLGLVNRTSVTYQYLRDGSVLPQGAPQQRAFRMNEYEFYLQDAFRVSRELTLNAGIRYSNGRSPYEVNGLQVSPQIGLDRYFAERNGAQAAGIPGWAIANPLQTYLLNGPANGKSSWYGPDNNNWAPHVSIAWAPQDRGGLIQKIFGKQGVLRAGAGIVYDRFGSQLITQFDQFGSQGVATTIGNPVSYDFTTSPRYTGSDPAQPAASTGGFPFTPSPVAAIVGEYQGIYPGLKTPYSYVANATFARELPGKLTLEIGYLGRFARKLLLQGDVYTPLERWKDPESGETWMQSMTTYRQIYDAGVTPAAVKANPSLVPANPFIESMFPAVANSYIPGASASANYFYGVYGIYGGSNLDMLHAVDRIAGASDFGLAPGVCATRTGCYTFFSIQGSSMPTWMNAGASDFNAGVITIRRAFSNGVSFDFNYTLSHSIDNASAAEGGAGQSGAAIQNIFNQGEFRGSSDFDIRHQINANLLYELPFGRNKLVGSNVPGWANQIIGGWQVSSIIRYNTGLPSVIQGNYVWNTNYWQNSLAIKTSAVKSGQQYDSAGNPSIFTSTDATSSFADAYPGTTGDRAVVRLAPFFNCDLAVLKQFDMPWEGHKIQFRAEAFNAFNNVNFIKPSLALNSPGTFGEFTSTTPPRVMQFALRYEF
jgi:hypothetical protein